MSTDWEELYQKGETPWDRGSASPGLVEFLARSSMSGRVLVPGCGRGCDVGAIAGHSQECEVVGIDIAESALASATELAGNLPNASIAAEDLFSLPESWRGTFDWVFEHTCYCAINPPMRDAYVSVVADSLRDGGRVLAVFYVDPDEDGTNGPPFSSTVDELDEQFAKRFRIVEHWIPSNVYPGREGCEVMRVLEKITPAES